MAITSYKMAFSKYKNFILFLLVVIMFAFGTPCRGLDLSPKKNVKVHKQVNHVNNYTIKTFQKDNGDIIDCVDIYKQPSLTHPLLIGHKVQLKPKITPKDMSIKDSANISSPPLYEMIQCPQGYVPIKRASKEDIMMNMHLNSVTMTGPSGASKDKRYYDAKLVFNHKKNYGAKGHINIWNVPNIPKNQASIASVWIADGLLDNENSIVAGWIVYPSLFKDTESRLFAHWQEVSTAKNIGCYNTLCPGFIQVNNRIHLGSPLKPLSVYGGRQYSIDTQIFQDLITKNWWLSISGQNVGYWPSQLFTYLKDGATYASWGGRVVSPLNEYGGPMGSGVMPTPCHGSTFYWKKAAYIRQIKINYNGCYNDPWNVITIVSDQNCYGLAYYEFREEYWKHHIYFGGPGGCLSH